MCLDQTIENIKHKRHRLQRRLSLRIQQNISVSALKNSEAGKKHAIFTICSE